ncbi:MAG: DUF6701 domain-containing protein [Aeromonas sp.]
MSRFLIVAFLWLLSAGARADLLLPGSLYIGDNSSDALSPTVLFTDRFGQFIPLNPIHFSLSAPLALAEIRLEGAQGLDAGVNVVIWDASGRVVLDEQASNQARDRVSRPQGWQLAAGEYRMAVWGGCFSSGFYVGRYDRQCQDWDDFTLTGIRLVASGSSAAFHFIERTHIGNHTDGNRWYPSAPSGSYAIFPFTLEQGARLDSLTLYNLRDWGVTGGSRMFIRTAGSAYTPLVYYFDRNGDITWKIDYELAAGSYELIVETLSAWDRDDISWDDIVLRYTQTSSAIDFSAACRQAFPYPAQGRQANHSIDLGGRKNSYVVGRISGTVGGALGYRNSGQIKGSDWGACDGGQCLPTQNTNSLALPGSRFPLPGGPSITVLDTRHRILTAADGASFDAVSVNNNGSLDIQQSGITIRSLNLYSGRAGKPYTVRLAAGDYWIDTLRMYNDTRIEVTGPVRLFVNDLSMGSASYINSPGGNIRGDINQLLLVSYGRVYLYNGSTLSGLVYQHDGSVFHMSSASYLHGRISSPEVAMWQDSVIDSSGYSCQTPPATVDHYELHYGSAALTCEPAQLQLKACTDSNCSGLYEGGASVTLSPVQGWSRNPVSLGSTGNALLTLQRYQSGGQTLAISGSSPGAPLRCYRDGVLDSSCTLNFVDAVLRFNLPTFYAGESASSEIRAIKSSDVGATRVCVPLLTGTQSLRFDYGKVISDPASRAAPVLNGVTLPTSGGVANVTFDANGVGQLTMQYPDAGVLRLDASVQKSDGTGTLNLKGSDTVAVLPKAIVLQGEGQPVCSGSDDAGYANCPVYRKAGESFVLLAQAVNSLNGATPGFAANGLSLDWQLLAPVGGARGGLSPLNLSMVAGSGRLDTSWSEVGVFKAGVSNFVPYPAYQDESPQLEVPLRWSAPVGRFVPANFNLLNSDITPFCNDFTYMGQPFGVSFRVQARNVAGGVTQNYQGPFAKGRAFISAANNKDGRSLTNRMRTQSPLPWRLGEAEVSGSSEFVRLSDSQPDGPYEAMHFGFAIRDNDGERSLIADPDFNEAVVGDCRGSACNTRLMDPVPMTLYFGRLLAGTAAGQASAALALSQQLQYYVAGSWQWNKRDECTQLSLANQGVTFLNPSHSFNAATRELNLGAGRKIRLGLGSSAPGGDTALAKDGEILFHFARPDISVRIPYKVELAKQPSQPLWLSDPVTLQGEAIFGSSRGNDRIIYRREVLQ